MIPRRITGANVQYGAPADWVPARDGVCGTLHVRQQGNICESAWEPTPKELELLNRGGSVILRVIGVQPVVALHVEFAKPEGGIASAS